MVLFAKKHSRFNDPLLKYYLRFGWTHDLTDLKNDRKCGRLRVWLPCVSRRMDTYYWQSFSLLKRDNQHRRQVCHSREQNRGSCWSSTSQDFVSMHYVYNHVKNFVWIIRRINILVTEIQEKNKWKKTFTTAHRFTKFA